MRDRTNPTAKRSRVVANPRIADTDERMTTHLA
jgi:hypothetical protein